MRRCEDKYRACSELRSVTIEKSDPFRIVNGWRCAVLGEDLAISTVELGEGVDRLPARHPLCPRSRR